MAEKIQEEVSLYAKDDERSTEAVQETEGDQWSENPRNPINWSPARKRTILLILIFTNLVA